MKIVYSILGTFNSGGMERVLANKANYLVSKGYSVTIITTDQKKREPYFALSPEIKSIDLGINYTDDLGKGIITRIFAYYSKQKLHKKKLDKVLKEINADIVISMFDNDSSFLYKIKDGSKKVLEIHFSRFKRLQYNRKGFFKWIDLYRSKKDLAIVKNYDKFVVLTNEDKGYWGDLANIQVIPNSHSFEPAVHSEVTNKQVLAVGRLDYQKGFDDLISAWSQLDKQFSDWRLDIYGHGPLGESLNRQILDLGLSEQVSIKPPISNIVDKYIDSSILAMTSRYEGLPMALLEGQVCGLPLVAYNCKCGPSDLIEDGKNGFLIQEGDMQGMTKGLETLMTDFDLRKSMSNCSLQKSKIYSVSNVMSQWEKLFKDLKLC